MGEEDREGVWYFAYGPNAGMITLMYRKGRGQIPVTWTRYITDLKSQPRRKDVGPRTIKDGRQKGQRQKRAPLLQGSLERWNSLPMSKHQGNG